MSQAIHAARLSTGVTLPYVQRGDPNGVPMVLLHGYSDSWRSYELLLPHLPESIRAYAYTQRGHAGADKPPAGYRVADHVADAAAFLDAVGVEAAVFVGHSAGSYVAQRFAIDRPDRTLGIALIAAFRSFADNPGVVELSEAVSQFTDPVDREFVREFQESCVARPVPAGFLDSIIAGSCEVPARVWKAYLAGLIAADVPTDTGVIAAPTLIQWGDRDAYVPREDQDALLAAIPGARLSAYHGTGHCPHWEAPQRAAAEITEFTAGAARAARRPTPAGVNQ